jgi:hypothetical protein
VQRSGGKVERLFGIGNFCTIYLTPVFESDASEYLLAAEFSQAVPEAGMATCVTDEYEADLPRAWQAFVDNSKVENCTVSVRPPPSDSAPAQPSQ